MHTRLQSCQGSVQQLNKSAICNEDVAGVAVERRNVWVGLIYSAPLSKPALAKGNVSNEWKCSSMKADTMGEGGVKEKERQPDEKTREVLFWKRLI